MRDYSPLNDPFPNQELDIAKNVRLIERLKTDLADQLAMIYKALLRGSDDLVAQALAGMMMICYLLGKRLGISHASLDRTLVFKLREMSGETVNRGPGAEQPNPDLALLSDYVEARMR